MLADLHCNASPIINPELQQLYDTEQHQNEEGRMITVEREQLYREVFGKNVELVL